MRFFLLLISITALLVFACRKEYSFEGGLLPRVDTLPPPPLPEFPLCDSCDTNTGTGVNRWYFKAAGYIFCGKIDTAVVSPSRTAFTFFGPSSCAADTGMVISILLEPGDTLNKNLSDRYTFRNAFYYYDRPGGTDIFRNRSQIPFPVTITGYDHITRIATGTFAGNVIRANGNSSSVYEGHFKVKL